MRVRWGSAVLSAAFVAGLFVGAAPGVDGAPAVAGEVIPCGENPVTVCDSDGDGVTDLVEEAICGTATCATGAEDADADGTADAVVLQRSLVSGGPGGPVQFPEFGEVLVVRPDGRIIQLAWWPMALAVVAAAALVTASVIFIRRGRAQ